MTSASDLSLVLDEFTGICAVGALDNPTVEHIPFGQYLLPKVTGATYFDKKAYPIAVWAGDRDGGSGTAETLKAWLRLGDETMDLSGPFEQKIAGMAPAGGLSTLMAAIVQASGMLQCANDALEYAEDEHDLASILEQLSQIASQSKSVMEYEADALIAHTDIMFNCMVDLLGNMAVAESQDVHLGFDLSAETLDPETGDKVTVKVGWAEDQATHSYVHSFQLGSEKCLAHDEHDMARMLGTLPETSREHYRHTFTHLHQAAHAVGEYAAGKVGEAIAKAGTVNDPLLHAERHDLTHRVHTGVVKDLNPFVQRMSGEPGRGEEIAHQH